MSCASLSLLSLLLSVTLAHPHKPVRRQNSVGTGPVISSNFQDPCLLQAHDTWYAFSGPNSNPPINVQVATSPDFSSWSVQEGVECLPDPGEWAASPPHVWAPDVVQLSNGQFVLYYAAALASSPSIHCIGAATAESPTGPYTPSSDPLFCDTSTGGSIDPNSAMDPSTGKMYVVYKVDGNSIGHGGACSNSVPPIVATPIILQEVSAIDGVTPVGDSITILSNEAEDGPLVEAPALVYYQHLGQWVLFYNSGCYSNTDYTINYATSSSISGPYERQGVFLATGSTAANVQLPGGIDLSPDGSKAVFHGDLNLEWLNGDADGSPRVRGMYAAEVGVGGGTVKSWAAAMRQ